MKSIRPSLAAQNAVYAHLASTADAEGLTTVSNLAIETATGRSPRLVEYAVSKLRADGRIKVAYTRTRQRVIKVN